MPFIIDKIKTFIDFHIYAILEFDILIGYPLENFIQEKPSHGGLDEKLGTTTFTTPIPCPESPKAKQQPNHNPFEEVKFISPLVSPKLAYETERSLSPSLEPKPCPFGHPNENFRAMDISKATLGIKKKDLIVEHESLLKPLKFHTHPQSLQS
jgi:hypothetical protein